MQMAGGAAGGDASEEMSERKAGKKASNKKYDDSDSDDDDSDDDGRILCAHLTCGNAQGCCSAFSYKFILFLSFR